MGWPCSRSSIARLIRLGLGVWAIETLVSSNNPATTPASFMDPPQGLRLGLSYTHRRSLAKVVTLLQAEQERRILAHHLIDFVLGDSFFEKTLNVASESRRVHGIDGIAEVSGHDNVRRPDGFHALSIECKGLLVRAREGKRPDVAIFEESVHPGCFLLLVNAHVDALIRMGHDDS